MNGNSEMMKTAKVNKISQVSWFGGHQEQLWAQSDKCNQMPNTSSSTRISPIGKEPPTNTSMDSGVAGLRDTPVHTPAPIHNNNNNNNMVNHKPHEEYEVPTYIVDHSTRTTYLRGRLLGKGGFARVHELTDLTSNKTYAGKIIPKCRITRPHHKEKIAREIEVHRHLRHRHVVRFHHYFEDDSNVYIILENCARRSLVHVLKHRKTLSEPEVRYYMRQLADGAAYIHGEKVIHRDLKLGNMFLTEDMTVKIGDFGLATRPGDHKKVTICGTPNYIAPEVLNKYSHSYEADIWAMGCIMYALLVGQPPFETDSLKETYTRITNNAYVMPPLMSKEARDLIISLLLPDPNERPTLPAIMGHPFFTTGTIIMSLPTSACEECPKLGGNGRLVKSASLPESNEAPGSKDINTITSSISTLRIPNHKQQDNNKICILDRDFGSAPPGQHLNAIPSKEEQIRKKENAGTLTSCLRQKLSSVICATDNKNANVNLGNKNRTVTSGVLYDLLAVCLDNMPKDMSTNPPVQSYSPLFITKWIDYSNKYGFGYQLSDLSYGIFFNDLTRISINHSKTRIEFHDNTGRVTTHSVDSLPAWLQERFSILCYFAHYMDENLTDAGEVAVPQRSQDVALIPHVRRWDRTPKSVIMQLSNGTFQINFLKDHTKIVIAGERSDVTVMFINAERQLASYKLVHISDVGCDASIRERLVYALSCLRQYAELDGEDV